MRLLLLVVLFCTAHALQDADKSVSNPLPVVPYPQYFEISSASRVFLDLNELSFTVDPASLYEDRVISSTISRYERYFTSLKRLTPRQSDDIISSVRLIVADPEAPLSLTVDESYNLTVGGEAVEISAVTRFGIIRGLETLYQAYNVTDGTIPDIGVIRDWPRFGFRGLLIDTSRHFLHLSSIFKVISGMAMIKLNVLHWHIVDDPSFPYTSRSLPDLAEKGAYDPGHKYSQADIQRVITFAEEHGVVVMPEFDTPGHTLSWGKALANFLTYCPGKGTFGGDYGPIDPSKEHVYQLLEKLFSEIVRVFPSEMIHLGGDEVPFDCWKANPDLVAWMKQKGIVGFDKLENYYENRLLDIIHGLNHSYVVWEEIFTNKLQIRPDTIVHVWKGNWETTMAKVVKGGFRTILSSPWYLNYITFSRDWKKYYEVEPLNITATTEEKKLVIGGEACMWGEFVDNSNILSRTFPRASSVAERLWSHEKQRDEPDMEFRLDKHRCGMCARGIPAETVILRSFCPYEFRGYDDLHI